MATKHCPYWPVSITVIILITLHLYCILGQRVFDTVVKSTENKVKMWWGYSAPLDLRCEIEEMEDKSESLEVLIIGACDARHIVKTLASSYKHSDCSITYHIIELTMEQVARSILLISTCLDKNLGLQEATRYYLEIMGNTLLRPATAKYLVKHSKLLADAITKTIDCPWLNLEKLKHKNRDQLEWIFKFWERATREGVPIVDYWDRRIRNLLKTRYDYRDGVFDWDYHMILKPRGHLNLSIHEYRFWRHSGIAFTWIEGEPTKSNPTLVNNIIPLGEGFLHYAYLGDITNGPFYTWALNEEKEKLKYRATDIAEREVMRTIHEIRQKEPFCEELVAAHRDPSILNGIIVTEMPNSEIENDSWIKHEKHKKNENIPWLTIPNAKVIFHPISAMEILKNKTEYQKKFDAIWIAHNMTKHLPNIVPLLKKKARVLIESRKYLSELRKEDLQCFTKELKKIAQDNGLKEINNFNAETHILAKFCNN